jgi:tetratricopeptide (TPR) repeat protein
MRTFRRQELKLLLSFAIVIVWIISAVAAVVPSMPQFPLQTERKSQSLTLRQVEDLIRNSVPDTAIAVYIQTKGIAFEVDSRIIGNLKELGAGPKTVAALNTKSRETTIDRCSTYGPIVILVTEFKSLDESDHQPVTEMILDQLREATRDYQDIEIRALNEIVSPQQGRDVAITKGRETGASFVIWGWYKRTQGKVNLTAHFESVMPSKLSLGSHDLSQLIRVPDIESLTIQIQLSKEIAYLALVAIGIARLEIDDYDGAIERLTRALEKGLAPDGDVQTSRVYFLRGLSYFNKAKFAPGHTKALDAAGSDFKKALDLNRNDASAHLMLGYTFTQVSEFEKAIEAANRALELKPNKFTEAAAWCLLLMVKAQRQETEEARANASRAIAALETVPQSEETFFLLTQIYFLNDDVLRAALNLDRAIALAMCPTTKAVYVYLRGIIYALSGNQDRALAEFESAIRLRPDYSYAYWAHGKLLFAKDQVKQAIEDYSRAIELNPTAPEFFDDRGDAQRSLDKFDEAIADYTKAVEINPNFSMALYDLGLAYRRRQRLNEAIDAFSRYIRLESKDVDGYDNRSELYQATGQWDLAILDVSEMIRLEPSEVSRYKVRGGIYEDKGELDKAVQDYSEYIRYKPDNVSGHLRRAFVYRHIKQWDKAIADYTTAVTIAPEDAWNYEYRAGTYAESGKDELAITDLQRVLQLTKDPNLKKIAEAELEQIRLRREIKDLKERQMQPLKP